MKSKHKFICDDSRNKTVADQSINLIVTSPPYPMIEMWDDIFKSMNNKIDLNQPNQAFKLMNKELGKVWKRMYKALKPGGIMIVNIGDATRTINKNFKIYTNGAKTIELCEKIGFDTLPPIHWYKPNNSPNKFMGSGMLPVNAYVTLEIEYILVFRKQGKRIFKKTSEIQLRNGSAFFWPERNKWFSTIWRDVIGTRQNIKGLQRKRNAAYPVKLAKRLINMYSIKGDLVLDPFGGTGSTTIAAIETNRNSILVDIDKSFIDYSILRMKKINVKKINQENQKRIDKGFQDTKEFLNRKSREAKYKNENYNKNVMTKQEQLLKIDKLLSITNEEKTIIAKYET